VDISFEHYQIQARMEFSLKTKGSLELGTLEGYFTLCNNTE